MLTKAFASVACGAAYTTCDAGSGALQITFADGASRIPNRLAETFCGTRSSLTRVFCRVASYLANRAAYGVAYETLAHC